MPWSVLGSFLLECREKDPQKGATPPNSLSSYLRGWWGDLQVPSTGETTHAALHFIFPPRKQSR